MTRKTLFAAATVAAVSLTLPAVVSSACRTGDPITVSVPAAPPDELETGVKLYQEGKYAEAEVHLRAASGVDAQAYLAGTLAKQKRYAEAEAPAKAALEANPTHDIAVAALGESLVGQKKYDEAVEKMSKVIKAKPELPYAYFWRGQAHYGKKQTDRMVADFETFVKLAPKAPEAPTIRQLLASLH